MKKLLSAALLLCVVAPFAAGCSSGGGTGKSTENTTASSSAAEATTLYEKDSLPDKLDFKGAEIKVLWWQEQNEFTDEQNGDVVNDALYARDTAVEDRLNVKIKNIAMSYTWATREAYINSIKSSVMAGDSSYDIVSGQYATMPSLISEGYLLNLASLPYLDFDKPWWVQGLIEETTIDGKLYLVSGDYTKQTIVSVCCMFYNKKLHDSLGLDDIYGIVTSGGWTIDKLKEMIDGTYADINGDGKKGLEDRYGLISYSGNSITPFIQAFDMKLTTMNSQGYPELSMNTPKFASAVELLCDLFSINTNTAIGTDATSETYISAFKNDLSLFLLGTFGFAQLKFNDMESDFGIIPYPKWDEKQESYYTAINEGNTLFGIVASCKAPETVAAVLEAAFSQSYRTVTPALYETALKVKYSRDNESGQMFDVIRGGILFNFGSIYGFDISQINTRFKGSVAGNNKNWASDYATYESAAKAAIDKLYSAVQQLDK